MASEQNPRSFDAAAIETAILAARTRRSSGAGGSGSGGTVHPVYGERRPMMYHLFDTELSAISSFNSVALSFTSLGSFCLSILLAIIIAYTFASTPVSEIEKMVFQYGGILTLGLSIIFYGFAVRFVFTRASMINQIKNETRSQSE